MALSNRNCIKAWQADSASADGQGEATCHACKSIPTENTFLQRLRRAAKSQIRDGVERGERSVRQAGGAVNMTRTEIVAAVTSTTTALRHTVRKLTAAESVIRNLKQKNSIAGVIRRSNPEVSSPLFTVL